MKRIFFALALSLLAAPAKSQFHSLTIPQASQPVSETQRVGVTDITLQYSSPRVRGRDVGATEIPQNGNPIAWRAGANMATTIE
ncbi:MAG TPA: hypothetical protein DCE41_36680, partial [Cytophagales bacterium]|nr:hypothetical protein [Cytophagales bacterium]